MDVTKIPWYFWLAASVSLLVVSCGLTVIAWKSSSFSIDLANKTIQVNNARLEVGRAAEETTRINEELKQENQRLAASEQNLRRELQARVEEASRKSNLSQADTKALTDSIKVMPPVKVQTIPDKRFTSVEKSLQRATQQIQFQPE
jgi:uncharacterized membrane protein YhiD involved in acid resistance